jgi:hypothetical protein
MERTTTTVSSQPRENGRSNLKTIIHQKWPSAIVALGLVLAVIWACLLGYFVAKIVALAI